MCSLNKKLLSIPLDCFIEICYKDSSFNVIFNEETKKKIKSIAKADDNIVRDFLTDFSKDGLKSFLKSVSKDIILEALKLLPFGGIAEKAIGYLINKLKN